MKPLLDVQGLSIGFGNAPPVVQDVNFSVNPGETLALVGESGSGKTLSLAFRLCCGLPDAAQLPIGQSQFWTK